MGQLSGKSLTRFGYLFWDEVNMVWRRKLANNLSRSFIAVNQALTMRTMNNGLLHFGTSLMKILRGNAAATFEVSSITACAKTGRGVIARCYSAEDSTVLEGD